MGVQTLCQPKFRCKLTLCADVATPKQKNEHNRGFKFDSSRCEISSFVVQHHLEVIFIVSTMKFSLFSGCDQLT